MASTLFGRHIKDALLSVTKALPAAASNNNTATIDLEKTAGTPAPENLEVEISIPAIAAHSDNSKSVTLKMQDSADDSSYSDTQPVTSFVLTGVTTDGSAAAVYRFRLPPGTRRYVQFNQAVASGAPSLIGSSITYSLRF